MSNHKNPDLTPEIGQLIRAALMRGVTIEETEITPEQKQRMQDRIDDLDADPELVWLVAKQARRTAAIDVATDIVTELAELCAENRRTIAATEPPVTVIVTTNCVWCYRPEDDHVDGCPYGPEAKT